MPRATTPTDFTLPPSDELFDKQALIQRHPNFLNQARLDWALRNRHENGLAEAGAVFETRGGEILIREPRFIWWFLGLTGRRKPRALRRARA
jgi:hypothetical protein